MRGPPWYVAVDHFAPFWSATCPLWGLLTPFVVGTVGGHSYLLAATRGMRAPRYHREAYKRPVGVY